MPTGWDGGEKRFKLLPVTDQGACGSCAPLTCARVCSSVLAIKENQPPEDFAYQELLNRLPELYPDECNIGKDNEFQGCMARLAFRYVKNHGLAFARHHPYQAKRTRTVSPQNKRRLRISYYVALEESYVDLLGETHSEVVAPGGGDRIPKQIDLHPIGGEFITYNSFCFYKEGIYCGEQDVRDKMDRPIYHAAVIVDYGVSHGTPFFWIQNTYGHGWGHEGYGRVARALFKRYCYPVNPRIVEPAGSWQSMDVFRHHKNFIGQSRLAVTDEGRNLSADIESRLSSADGHQNITEDAELLGFRVVDLEGRLSDISDGELSMGTETDGSINSNVEFTLFPETVKAAVADNKDKHSVPSKLPRPSRKMGFEGSSRLSLPRGSNVSSSSKSAGSSSSTMSSNHWPIHRPSEKF